MNVFIKDAGRHYVPKVIGKVREQLLDEVRRQITENGYASTTIRSVAEGCSISVGTVYNYFRSKDILVATAVAEDWEKTTRKIMLVSPSSAGDMLSLLWNTLRSFEDEHRVLFTDPEAEKKFSSVFTEWHSVLRGQIASFLSPFLDGDFLPLFISEALLTWVTEGVEYEKFYSVTEKLIDKETKK